MGEPRFEARQTVTRAPALNPKPYGSDEVPTLKELLVREEKNTWARGIPWPRQNVYNVHWRAGWVREDLMLLGKSGSVTVVRQGHVTKVIFDRGLGGYHQSAFSTILSEWWILTLWSLLGSGIGIALQSNVKKTMKHYCDGLRVDWLFRLTGNLIIHLGYTSAQGLLTAALGTVLLNKGLFCSGLNCSPLCADSWSLTSKFQVATDLRR